MNEPTKKKIVIEFDVQFANISLEHFLKLMVDYIQLCRFTTNVVRADMYDVDNKIIYDRVILPQSDIIQ